LGDDVAERYEQGVKELAENSSSAVAFDLRVNAKAVISKKFVASECRNQSAGRSNRLIISLTTCPKQPRRLSAGGAGQPAEGDVD